MLSKLILLAACTEEVDRELVFDGPPGPNAAYDTAYCRGTARTYGVDQLREARQSGALIGGLIGALDADDGDRLDGAIGGAVLGSWAAEQGEFYEIDRARRDILIRCMQGRGHRVIG
ncbi:glycine zipper family protein [Thalassococcus sp. S3]|nr:glycine zipper family protein [Thalassococcus sp. S3]